MNGATHYREAERLLLSCQIAPADGQNAATYPGLEHGVDTTTHALMAAQVHATLALAASTADRLLADLLVAEERDSVDLESWAKARDEWIEAVS